MRKIIVCARDSPLSRAQVAEAYRDMLRHIPEAEFSYIYLPTRGDLDKTTSLRHLEKTDFFTRELDELLLSGKADFAVHSAKDLPDPLPEGLQIWAMTLGVDPRDALVIPGTLEELPLGARIGTSSIRREAMLRTLRPDLVPIDIRGTIEERLVKVERGELEGVVVAEAALLRLGLRVNRILLGGETHPMQGRLTIIKRKDFQIVQQVWAAHKQEEVEVDNGLSTHLRLVQKRL